ncbi:hypothetical protein ACFYPF_26065 [Micromonospora sp. NPDC005223]|uniref:hypothetical protein n=1 Tax=unclassified Micromonospora TaxID=2617518 RepID=UPI0033B034D1
MPGTRVVPGTLPGGADPTRPDGWARVVALGRPAAKRGRTAATRGKLGRWSASC